jgi:CRP/FNR family transcriptional regulator, cyclic AMP receptor protein
MNDRGRHQAIMSGASSKCCSFHGAPPRVMCWFPGLLVRAAISLSAAHPVTNMRVESKTTASRADALARFELFQGLPARALAALSRRCQWRRYRAHQIILGFRDESRDVFFVVRGQVRVTFFSKCGREVSFRDLPAGEMFGELSAIDGLPRSCTVVASIDTTVAVMPASLLWDLLREYESVTASILRRLTRLVRALSQRVVEFSTLPVQKRIQVELLRLARDAAPAQNCAVIFPAPTHADLAHPGEHSSGSGDPWPRGPRARRYR